MCYDFQAGSKRRDSGFKGKDGKEVKGRVLKLHHVKWMESHDLELQEGIMVTLKVTSVRQNDSRQMRRHTLPIQNDIKQ